MDKIILSISMIIILILLTFILAKKYKLDKRQLIIFLMLVLFWTSISVIRAYRKVYVTTPISLGGLGLSSLLAAEITSAYGLISFIIRMPLFFMTDILKKRKLFIQTALLFMLVSSISVIIKPSYNTLYISSLAMGISASMLAIFNVMFSETFSKEGAATSASILAIAPLLAEFIAAPIQYLGTYSEIKHFYILWTASAILSLLTFILSLFFREIKDYQTDFNIYKVKKVINNKNFIIICFIGIIISFVKFSTSGANMILYAKEYTNMNSIMLAYLDTVFSGFQLIASVLVGTYFKNKYGIEKTLLLSLTTLAIFYIIMLGTNNPNILFISYALNGFGYGGTYISLISMAMQYFDKTLRNISMGIFQGFFAFGIYFGDRIYVWLNRVLEKNNSLIFGIVLTITVISILVVFVKLVIYRKEYNE